MDDERTHGQMAERNLALKTRCSSKEKRSTGFDAFKGHLTQKVETVASNLLNMDLVIIPGGIASQLQVLDEAVNKQFKD
jgi:hypothetical protein